MAKERMFLKGVELSTKEYADSIGYKVEHDAIILEVYFPNRTDVTLNTQENRDKLSTWFSDILDKGYYRPLYISSGATGRNLKQGYSDNKYLYRVLMVSGFPLKDKPREFFFYCLPTFSSGSTKTKFGVVYRSAEQLETRAVLSWNDDGTFLGVASVVWSGAGIYLPVDYTGTSNSHINHLPLGVGNTTEYTPTGDYNPSTKKYTDDTAKTEASTAVSSKLFEGNSNEWSALTDAEKESFYIAIVEPMAETTEEVEIILQDILSEETPTETEDDITEDEAIATLDSIIEGGI